MTTTFDFLNDINVSKEFILNEENKSDYVPYFVNHFLAGSPECLSVCQSLNLMQNLDKDLHFVYLFDSIKQKKRFSKWLKPDKYVKEDVELVCEAYQVNKRKAIQYLRVLTAEQLEKIRETKYTGEIIKE